MGLLPWTLSPSELALSPLAMKEEGRRRRRRKGKMRRKRQRRAKKKDKVKKISTVSVPATKKSRTWNELMTAESFRSSSLLVGLTMILVLSTVLLVIVAILVGSFRISLFTMASLNFLAGPIMMVISSTIGILLAVFGFIMVFKRHFNLYIGLAACSLVAFLLQIVAVVLAFILRENIDSDFNKVNVEAELEGAAEDAGRMALWDQIQERYQCCGGHGTNGFLQWEDVLNGTYPDSCCTVSYPDCGRQARRTLETTSVYERIHVRGCISVVGRALEEHVMPMLMAWGLLGIIVALAELLLLLLCLLFAIHLRSGAGHTRLTTSPGKCELEPLAYTSTTTLSRQQKYTSTLSVRLT